jgi:hypothetical protein
MFNAKTESTRFSRSDAARLVHRIGEMAVHGSRVEEVAVGKKVRNLDTNAKRAILRIGHTSKKLRFFV